ncbi:MAG: DUF2059 domain-containing protein [Pseudanabaena sp.]
MSNRIFSIITLSALLATGSVFVKEQKAIAQTASDTQQSVKPLVKSTVISPKKYALIRELLEITESEKNASKIMEAMVRNDLTNLVSAILKAAPALDNDHPEAQKQFSEIVSNMANKYRDRVIAKIDIPQLIEEISYPIYDKYFTEIELSEIIGFYKSATGKKAIALMPQIINDSMRRTNEILLPKMAKIMTEIITQELPNLLPKQK